MTDPTERPSSEALASMVVAYRSLGLFKDQAKEAMSELAKRKDEGDDFDYETFISQKLKEVPKSDMNPEISKFLSSLAYLGSAR
jgi:Holliday junction resolvasome RuvABC DNA-binding subunit